MLISLAANGLNIVLNYFLIYPAGMGVDGAAIASAVSYMLSGILMFIFCIKNSQLSWKFREFSVDRRLLGECASVGTPVLGTSMVSCFGYVVFAGLVSGMGTTVFAAHSIAVTAETIFYVPGYGLRSAASTLIGNARGEGNKKKLKTVGILSVLLTVAVMCVSGLVLFFGAHLLMSLFTPSRPVVDLGAEMLRLVALSEPFFGLMVVLEGIFLWTWENKVFVYCRDGGNVVHSHPVYVPLCAVLGIRPKAVWYCMIATMCAKPSYLQCRFCGKKAG